MDTTNPSLFSVSATSLATALNWSCPPLLLDVRENAAFSTSTCMLLGTLHSDPRAVARWGRRLPRASSVVVYCDHGQAASIDTTLALREMGIDARYLEDGIEGWRARGLPLVGKPGSVPPG